MNLFRTIAVFSISIIASSLLCSNTSFAQAKRNDSTNSKWQAGAELDLLPYATGGYFTAGWVGKKAAAKKPVCSSQQTFFFIA